eukprot:scaffold2921_cov61-Phaeocystis_antarctica.AAC.3
MWVSRATRLARYAIYLPEIRLRFKADAQAEARGGVRRVAAEGVELAPDACLQLPFVCQGERPICQPHLSLFPASTAVHVLGRALGEHHEQRDGIARAEVWLDHVPHLGRVRVVARVPQG